MSHWRAMRAELEMEKKRIVLAWPRGFCAGVVRAVDIVNLALEIYGRPIYVLNEIVHNRHVVNELHAKGVQFVSHLDEVPDQSRLIFSAHGVAPAVRQAAVSRRLTTIDATCPLVTKVHLEAIRFRDKGYTIILIGHRNHDEVIGTRGEAPDRIVVVTSVEEVDRLQISDTSRLAFLTQTTLSVDDSREIVSRLRERFPGIEGPSVADICYATQNRQRAVQDLARQVDLVLVIGSSNSSNTNRLVEVASETGKRALLVESSDRLQPEWWDGVRTIGITAGASTPEVLVTEVIDRLQTAGFEDIEELETVVEDVHFSLPAMLEKDLERRGSVLHPETPGQKPAL